MIHWQSVLTTELQTLIKKPRLGLVTDMDGTISPIVDQPDLARVTPRSRELLQSLHGLLALVAVVSGRAVDDVRQRVDLPELVYIGNHGLERWENGGVVLMPEAAQYRPALQSVYDLLNRQLLPGMTIEDKVATLSIHYRQSSDPQSTASQFRSLAQTVVQEHGLRLFEGRMIFEVRPPIDIDKGTTFHSLVSHYQLDAALYIGDDTTDVDALRMARKLRESGECYALGIGVQSSDMPEAVNEASDLVTAGVSDVEDFLAWLLKACSASSN